RQQRGFQRLDGRVGPTVLTQAVWIGASLPSGGSLSVTVPVAQIFAPDQTYGGLGDVAVQAAQQAGAFRVAAGLSVPTGATGERGAVQTVHVEGDDGGLT